MRKLLLILLTTNLIFSCGIKPTLSGDSVPEINPEQADMDGDEISDDLDEYPDEFNSLDLDTWIASRDQIISEWEADLTKAESVKKDRKTTFNTFNIISAIVSAGAGIFGLIDDESTVPSVGSLVTGSGAALFSTLSLAKAKQNADECYRTLQREISLFKTKWTDIDFPDTDAKLAEYRSDKLEVTRRINESCYE